MAAPDLIFVHVKLWIRRFNLFVYKNTVSSRCIVNSGLSRCLHNSRKNSPQMKPSHLTRFQNNGHLNPSSSYVFSIEPNRWAAAAAWAAAKTVAKESEEKATKSPEKLDEKTKQNPSDDSKQTPDGNDKKAAVPLMDFQQVVWPGIIKSIKSYFLTKLVIQMHFDPEFNLEEFMQGTRHAVYKVSRLLSEGDFESLKGLVSDEALVELKTNVNKMNVKQRQELTIGEGDIYFAFIHLIGVMFDEDSNKDPQKRLVEITCCFHCLHGFEELKRSDPTLNSMFEQRHRIIVCNYRFIREFTKGVKGEWIINKLNHFRPAHLQ